MLLVQLTEESRDELKINSEHISWSELKQRLKDKNDAQVFSLLKGAQFTTAQHKHKPQNTLITPEEYAKLAQLSPNSPSEFSQLRSEMSQLRRESTWLLNCLFSALGTSVFVHFLASFYSDRFEVKLIAGMCAGILLFFLEILLYIIRTDE